MSRAGPHADGWHWFSTERMSVAVFVRAGRVNLAPPIARRFVGQPLVNLERWLARQPNYRHERLTKEAPTCSGP